MSQILFFSVTSAFNPTLLTATMVMLLLPSPKRLLWGYLLGAYMTSISLGLVIVFALDDSAAVDTTKDKISPAADIALGLILLIVAIVLKTGYHTKRSEQRKKKKEEKEKEKEQKTPRWQEVMSKGRARDTFVVGALLTLPGASYLAGLTEISKEDFSTLGTVLCVVGFNLVMLTILEIPLLGYTFAPDWTRTAMTRMKETLNRDGQRILYIVALVMGLLLIVRGVIEFIA